MKILGIESSCDECSAAIVEDGRILSHIIASQIPVHARYGGVASTEQCDIKAHTNDAEARFNGCVECKKVSPCGNSKLEAGETCDPGHWCKTDESGNYINSEYKDLCAPDGKTKIEYKAIEGCNEDTCRYNDCGNGKLDDGEDCDCKDGDF